MFFFYCTFPWKKCIFFGRRTNRGFTALEKVVQTLLFSFYARWRCFTWKYYTWTLSGCHSQRCDFRFYWFWTQRKQLLAQSSISAQINGFSANGVEIRRSGEASKHVRVSKLPAKHQQNISEEYKKALGMFKGPSETNKNLDWFSGKKKLHLEYN